MTAPDSVSPGRGGAAMRLRGLIRKEARQILRDPSSIAIAFLMPLVLLLLFGYGVSLDAENVPIAIVVEQPSADAESLAGAFRHSRYFAPVVMHEFRDAERAMAQHRVDAVLRLRANFARRLTTGRGSAAQLLVNGTDANNARLITGYVDGAWAAWVGSRAGSAAAAPVVAEPHVWFNSELRSRNFLVPGLIAVIMTLIGALLTSMVIAREWERGTMEALLVTPVSIFEVLFGKVVPYFALGMGGLILSVVMAVALFGVPLRGSLWVLFAASAVFLLVALGMGLLISTIAKNQFVAGQVAIIVTFLPAFILSGFIFDIGSMPWPVQAITHVIPARYFVSILQTVFLAGDVWAVVVPNFVALAVMSLLVLGLAGRLARKSLE